MSRRPSAMRTSSACTMPAMPSLIVRRYWMSASMNACGSNAVGSRGPNAAGDDELRVRLRPRGTARRTPRSASFQFTGRRHAYHHSARSDSTFHASRSWRTARGTRAAAARRRSRLIHAHPPQISHRTGVRSMSSGLQVVLGERPPLRDDGVLAVGAVAPAVERAREPARAGAAGRRRPSRRGGGRRSGTP